MKNKYKDLTNNTLLFAISSFGTKIISFFLVPLYTNVLSTGDYGTADILYTSTTLLIIFLTLNIQDAVLVFALDKKNDYREVWDIGQRIVLIAIGVVACGCIILNRTRLVDGIGVDGYVFVFAFFVCSSEYQLISNFARAKNYILDVAVAGIISSVFYIGGNLLFLCVLKQGMRGYLMATVLGPLSGAVYLGIRTGIKVNYFNKLNNDLTKSILKYSFPLMINSLALWINSFLDRYFVTFYCGKSENGVYAVGSKIPTILSTCYSIFSQAWIISAVGEFDENDQDGFFSNIYKFYYGMMSLVCSLIIVFNIFLAYVLYAKDFFVAWRCSSILVFATFFNALTAYMGGLFSAKKRSKVLALTTFVSAMLNTILNILLIPNYGVIGASVATLISYMTMCGIRAYYLKDIIKLNIPWPKHLLVIALIIVQIVVQELKPDAYAIQIVLFGIICMCFAQEINTLIKVLKNKFLKLKKESVNNEK